MARKKSPLVNTAESIGAALGQVMGKLDAWKKQRAEIAADIQQVLRSAQTILAELGETTDVAFARARKSGRRKGYVMSADTKAKLRAAWARRKAAAGTSSKGTKGTKGTKGKRTISPEGRARIAAAQRARWAKQKA